MLTTGTPMRTDSENMADIEAQVTDLGVNYAIAIGDGVLEEAVGGVYSIPTTFILDRDGFVVEKHIGLVSEEELNEVIGNLF